MQSDYRVHASGVFTQRTQISPLTLDVTTNKYFIVQRETPNIFGKITTIILSHPPHTHDRNNSPTVQYHCSFLLSPWTLFILSRPWTLFLLLSFSRGPLSAFNYFPSYVGLHPASSWLIPSGRACLSVPAHHACSTYMLSLHPRFNLQSRLLPITQFPCRSAHN